MLKKIALIFIIFAVIIAEYFILNRIREREIRDLKAKKIEIEIAEPKEKKEVRISKGIIAFTSDRLGSPDIYLMKIDGTVLVNLTRHPAWDGVPSWSPDGKRIVFQSGRDNYKMHFIKSDGTDGEESIKPENCGRIYEPSFSPNGKKILFSSEINGNHDIFVMNSDGTGLYNLLIRDTLDPDDWAPCWSPDGKKISFTSDRNGNADIFVMNINGLGLVNLTNHPASDSHPAWSPDGKKIIFQSDRDGNFEIYMMNIDSMEFINLTKNKADDRFPAWYFDDKILFTSNRDDNEEIYIMNKEGDNQINLSRSPGCNDWASTCPLYLREEKPYD